MQSKGSVQEAVNRDDHFFQPDLFFSIYAQ